MASPCLFKQFNATQILITKYELDFTKINDVLTLTNKTLIYLYFDNDEKGPKNPIKFSCNYAHQHI